jgi:mRNA interferase RelE/StbE
LSYQVELAPAAVRQLKKLTRDIQERIVQRLEDLAQEPRPDGVVKLESVESLYRIRLGDYRIVYQIQDEILLIIVVKIAHRREVYR